MHNIEKIYLDLDGVVADFVTRFRSIYGMNPDEADAKKRFSDFFTNFIKDQNFATLDLMPDAQFLIDYLKNVTVPVEILSSTGRPEGHEEVSRQKGIWLDRHNIPFKQNFVPGKELKYKFATPNSILIDDTLSNIDDWKQAGGIAIHHKNARETMMLLKFHMLGLTTPKYNIILGDTHGIQIFST
jgi:hypothetical protein